MRKDEPLDLDDEDEPPRRRRDTPPPPPGAVAAGFLGVAKWLLLGLGAVLAAVAFTQNAAQAAALSGLACFLGIAARVVQAEEHRHRRD